MAATKIGKGASNADAIVNNKPRKRFLKYYCIGCGSEKIKPVRVYSASGKNRGTFWQCEDCKQTNKLKKIVEL